jgi:hypothetical protein
MKLVGLHDDNERKPIRLVFGTVWLLLAVHGGLTFASATLGHMAGLSPTTPVNLDQIALDFMLWFLLPLAISVMFFRSHKHGMVILLALTAWRGAPVLIAAFQAMRAGHHVETVPLGFPLLLVGLSLVSAWASAATCGIRIQPVRREPLFH